MSTAKKMATRKAQVMKPTRFSSKRAPPNVPVMTRSNVYAYKPGCMIGLEPYLPAGDDRFNDIKMGKGCK